MTKLISVIFSVFLCLSAYAQTSNDSCVRAAAIVDGLFFDKSMPAKSLIPGGSTAAVLKDPEGNIIMAVYLPKGYVLEKSIIDKSIPADRVAYAKKLLRDYEGRRPQTTTDYTGIGITVGEPFIEFEYRDTDNNIWNNEKLKDKIYVINLWQTECGPCRREMPILSKWKDQFPDVVFLSASRHNTEEILPIAKQHNFTWTHLQEAADLVALVRQQGFPLTIVVDKNGIIRFAKVGATEENQAEAVSVIEELSRR
ncbi:MAG: TlpA family protein disulfide reductase [Muribaculaceae bacterium]|nr:TlpA family protein disulfide reductase [Muribaculaceae bacterium]